MKNGKAAGGWLMDAYRKTQKFTSAAFPANQPMTGKLFRRYKTKR